MSKCIKCGTSGKLIKENGVYYCWDCYTSKSPIVDETWRIIKHSLDHELVWVDMSAERRKSTNIGRRLRR